VRADRVQRLGVDEPHERAAEHAAPAHRRAASDRVLGGSERLRGAALGEADRRERTQGAWTLEGHHHPERDLELALGALEVPHATQHLREPPTTAALFQRNVTRVSIFLQLGC
jgi:hypothetical protein